MAGPSRTCANAYGFVAGCRKEPRLDRPSGSHALDPPAALGEPDIAKAASEETALVSVLGGDSECAEPAVDRRGVDAFAIVTADDLVAPVEKRRDPEAPKLAPPGIEKRRIRRTEAEVDAAAPSSRGSDRGIGIRQELRDDLGEVDPGLSEVLSEVPAADASVTKRCGIESRHSPENKPTPGRLLRSLGGAVSGRSRSAAAGAAAATVWALQEPLDQRLLRCDYSDVALLGKAVTRGPGWRIAGLGLYPLSYFVDRHHPARGEPGVPPLLTNPRVFAQATWRHALFGVVLGRLSRPHR